MNFQIKGRVQNKQIRVIVRVFKLKGGFRTNNKINFQIKGSVYNKQIRGKVRIFKLKGVFRTNSSGV